MNNLVNKNINCYVSLSLKQKNEVKQIFRRYNRVKNYVVNRYSGRASYLMIFNHRKEIRDVWTKNGLLDDFKLPKRYVRNAIDDSIGNIKVHWIQTFKNAKQIVNRNIDLTNDEKHYIFYSFKSKEMIFNIINFKEYKVPKKFIKLNLNIKKLHIYIRRVIRQAKPIKSKYRPLASIMIDPESYLSNGIAFNLTSLTKSKRFKFKLNTKINLSGNLRLILIDKGLRVSKCIEIKSKINNYDKHIGIDKNYLDVLDTSSENTYGQGFNHLQNSYTDDLDIINKKRQVYIQLIKDLELEIKDLTDLKKVKEINKKINNIKKFNLGKKKYNRTKNRYVENIKKLINKAVKEMIRNEKISMVSLEQLNFTSNKKKRNKKSKNKMSRFVKGIVQSRLEYHCSLNNIKIDMVNAAYTSQECLCGLFGDRKNDIFHCQKCGKVGKSGHVAAKSIKKRSYDKEITLYTPFRDVKSILQKRLVDNNVFQIEEYCEPNQPRP